MTSTVTPFQWLWESINRETQREQCQAIGIFTDYFFSYSLVSLTLTLDRIV